jgi:hypothetical protein
MKKSVIISIVAVSLFLLGGWVILLLGRWYSTALSLKHFQKAVIVYAKENAGRYPESLQQIVDDGFLGKNDLLYIGKGLPFTYSRPDSAQTDSGILTTSVNELVLFIRLSGKLGWEWIRK